MSGRWPVTNQTNKEGILIMMADTKAVVVTGKMAPMAKSKAELQLVDYGKLVPSKSNPRKDFNKDALNELAGSIREHGIKQPLIVRPVAGGKFEIVGANGGIGRRGWRSWRRCRAWWR
jgi:ParB family chromosome partitioning protein